MKKVLKIVGIILLVIIILVVVILAVLSKMAKQKEERYYEYSNAVGEIEKKYTAMGELNVASKEYDSVNASIGKFVIWYPFELENSEQTYPVVLWANGTGSKASTYKYFLSHLASWGFIAVDNDDENTRTGESLNAGIDLLIAENENPDSVFYHKIDLDHIGIGGHSQGGPAVFNMITNQSHGDMIRACYAVSAGYVCIMV